MAAHRFANMAQTFSLLSLLAESNGRLWLGTHAAAACAVIDYDGSRLLSADEMILIKMLHAGASHWPGWAALQGLQGLQELRRGPCATSMC